MRSASFLWVAPTLLLSWMSGCGGVQVQISKELAVPSVVAVLPMGGEATPRELNYLRSRVREQLRVRYLNVFENDYVDRVLSERGWLADPDRFDPEALPVAEVREALGVEGVVMGHDFRSGYWNFLLLYRRSLRGVVGMYVAGGEHSWQARHRVSRSGGILLELGQIFSALRNQFQSGSPRVFVALAEEFVADVLATLPELQPGALRRSPPPRIAEVEVKRLPSAAPEGRIQITVEATPAGVVSFDLLPEVVNMPTVEVAPGRYRGIYTVVRGDELAGPLDVKVHIRDPFGRQSTETVQHPSQVTSEMTTPSKSQRP
ncbi:MAG: hypothetical protein V3T77_08990 [Planctomycetota bacterium]